VRVLSRLFRRLFLERLLAMHQGSRLKFFGNHSALTDPRAFATYLAPLRRTEWVVHAKRPFGGPQAVLAYLSRYTHRVAIANSRLIACDHAKVTFRWKDYRADGRDRQKVMRLATGEFIRRFLIHVLPQGFHRMRHYGLLASGTRADNIARARELLAASKPEGQPTEAAVDHSKPDCPCCGGRMIIIEVFERGATPRYRPARGRGRVLHEHQAQPKRHFGKSARLLIRSAKNSRQIGAPSHVIDGVSFPTIRHCAQKCSTMAAMVQGLLALGVYPIVADDEAEALRRDVAMEVFPARDRVSDLIRVPLGQSGKIQTFQIRLLSWRRALIFHRGLLSPCYPRQIQRFPRRRR
jgi:hypothetical protein